MPELINVINKDIQLKKVSLIQPSTSVYFFLVAEIDRSIFPFYLFQSSAKKSLLKLVKEWCLALEQQSGIINATAFSAILVPPGRGKFLESRRNESKVANYDVAVLIEADSLTEIDKISLNTDYQNIIIQLNNKAKFLYQTIATNVKRIAAVDHRTDGIFLFNYFYADSLQQNLAIWEYTAGWFQQVTGLDNSTVLLPVEKGKSVYTIINHCRWNKLSDILPALLFNKTFRTYVLDNFYANNVAAMPILYTKI